MTDGSERDEADHRDRNRRRLRRCCSLGVIMEGGNPMAFINIPALPDRDRRHVLRAARLDEHGAGRCRSRSSRSSRSRAARPSTGPAAAKQMVGLAEKARREGCSRSRRARGGRRRVHEEGRPAGRRRHRLRPRRGDPPVRDRRHVARGTATNAKLFATAGRLRADARHPRHRPQPRARAREPLEPGRARPLDRRRVHRDALRRRRGEPHLPADRQQLKGLSEVEVDLPRDDPRGRPRHPGRRQPAHAGRAARHVPRPPSARGAKKAADGRRGGRAAAGGGRHERARRRRHGAATAAGAAAATAAGTRAATSAGSSPTRT